jgi:hypothetical protein
MTKLSKVLEKIKEVMRWLEEADSEHLHLLHLANIKQPIALVNHNMKCTLRSRS